MERGVAEGLEVQAGIVMVLGYVVYGETGDLGFQEMRGLALLGCLLSRSLVDFC